MRAPSNSAAEKPQPPQLAVRSWLKRFAVWRNVVVGIILVTPFFVRAWFVSQVPDIPVPFDVQEFYQEQVPVAENAFEHYREAARMFDAISAARHVEEGYYDLGSDMEAVCTNGWKAATLPVRAWLDDFRPAVLEWRRGTEMSQAIDDEWIRPSDLMGLPVEINFMFRGSARFALLEGSRLEAENDFDEAANWYIAVMRSSLHGRLRGSTIQWLVGDATYSMGSGALARWSEIPDLTSLQIQRALKDVQIAHQLDIPPSSTLKAEYLYDKNVLNRADWWGLIDFDDYCGKWIGSRLTSTDVEYGPVPFLIRGLLWTVGEPLRTQRLLRHRLANQLREIDKPLPIRSSTVEITTELLFQPSPVGSQERNELAPIAIDHAIQCSVVAKQIRSFTRGLDALYLRERAQQSMLEILLAAQAYRREMGEFPEDPTILVPAYLNEWPIDAWDKTGNGIHYRRVDPQAAVIWSVGQNGIDDDGDVGDVNFSGPAPDFGVRLIQR